MKLELIKKCDKYCIRQTIFGFIPLYESMGEFWFWPDRHSWYIDEARARKTLLAIQAQYLLDKGFRKCKTEVIYTITNE